MAAELTRLADLLDAASDAQWDTASLCAGWRVREVVAHMTMAARYPQEQFMAELQRCGFDFTRLSNEIAARDARLPAGELIKNLRSEVMQHWAPPGGGYRGALNHAVIHGLDVTVPLGVPRLAPDQTILVILDDLTEGDVNERFGIDVAGTCRQPTWTGRSARARCCVAPPPTSRWSSAAARSRPDGSKAPRSSCVSQSTEADRPWQ